MNTIDKNEFFRQATIRICSSLDIEKSLENCYLFLNRYMPVTQMYLQLFNPSTFSLNAVAVAPKLYDRETYEHVIIPDKIRTLFKTAWMEQEEVIIINRPEQENITQILQEVMPLKGRSIMVLPLKLEAERLGTLTVYNDGSDSYTSDHAELLSLLKQPFAIAMSNTIKHQKVIAFKDALEDDNQYLHSELLRISGDEIIGADTGLKGVMEMVRQVAPLNSPVLLIGETGVGKEVIANAIHCASSRKNGPFIKVNCGAIPENLVDSELFGHEKGAFTGASSQKRGRFERAHNGTIFLDEIAELPPPAQVRILRVIQNGELERVGGTSSIKVDIRIISATHRNLEEMIRSSRFREDLWFRLNVFPIMIPPLRQRKEDLPALVQYFLQRKSKEMKLQYTPRIEWDAIERLKAYSFPGNVRELENMIERSLILSQGLGNEALLKFETFFSNHQADEESPLPVDSSDMPTLDEVIRIYINQVLNKVNGKIGGKNSASQILGLHPSTLRSRMNKLGISVKDR